VPTGGQSGKNYHQAAQECHSICSSLDAVFSIYKADLQYQAFQTDNPLLEQAHEDLLSKCNTVPPYHGILFISVYTIIIVQKFLACRPPFSKVFEILISNYLNLHNMFSFIPVPDLSSMSWWKRYRNITLTRNQESDIASLMIFNWGVQLKCSWTIGVVTPPV
jgi:hypothetical protein